MASLVLRKPVMCHLLTRRRCVAAGIKEIGVVVEEPFTILP